MDPPIKRQKISPPPLSNTTMATPAATPAATTEHLDNKPTPESSQTHHHDEGYFTSHDSHSPPLKPQTDPQFTFTKPHQDDYHESHVLFTKDFDSLSYRQVKHKITVAMYEVVELFMEHGLSKWNWELAALETEMFGIVEAALQRAIDRIWQANPFKTLEEQQALLAISRLEGLTPEEHIPAIDPIAAFLNFPVETDEDREERKKKIDGIMKRGWNDVLLWAEGIVKDWNDPVWRNSNFDLQVRREFWRQILNSIEQVGLVTMKAIQTTSSFGKTYYA